MTLPHPSLLPLDGQLTALRDPIALAAFWGWNDGGATATSAIRYLREDWEATEVARVDPDRFHDLSVARPRLRRVDGEPVLRWPGARIHAASPRGADHDIITIAGREPALRWREFSEAVANVLEAVGARHLLLLGSRGARTPHTRPAPVGLEGSEYFEQLLRLESDGRGGYQGRTGINTVLLLALRERGIDRCAAHGASACLHQRRTEPSRSAGVDRAARPSLWVRHSPGGAEPAGRGIR